MINYTIMNISFNIIVTIAFLISYIIYFELQEYSKVKITGASFLFMGMFLLIGTSLYVIMPLGKIMYIGKLLFVFLITVLMLIPSKLKFGYPHIVFTLLASGIASYFLPTIVSIDFISSGSYGKSLVLIIISIISFFLSKTSKDTRMYATPLLVFFLSSLVSIISQNQYFQIVSEIVFIISGLLFIINIKDFKLKERSRSNIQYEKIKKEFDEEVEKEVKRRMFYVELSKEKITEKSRTDGLTGALNKNSILDEMDTLIMNKHRYSMLIFDIDKFKTINDTLGHIAGDMCLRNLSAICKSKVTKNDFFGRYGGDEFIIVLPGKRFDEAMDFGEDLRKTVEEKTDPQFTISIGVAEFPQDGYTVKEILKWSDESLYISKHKGRNTISHKKSKLYMKKHGIEEEES